MEMFKTIVQTGSFILFIILMILILVAFSKILKLNKKVNRLKRRYDMILKGSEDVDLEEVLVSNAKEIESIREELKIISSEKDRLNNDTNAAIKKVGFVRYDAFSDLKNKLSYTIVLLDGKNNGVMLSSIYGRETSVTFAKKVENGKAMGKISEEEKSALNKAITS